MTTLLDVSGILRPVAPTGACQCWVESRAARCGKPTDGMLCLRHMAAAQRRLTTAIADDTTRKARLAAERTAAAPRLRDRLARVEAEITRLDPPAPTTDRAAYGGVGPVLIPVPDEAAYTYLVARNANNEGIYLVWHGAGSNTDLTEEVYEAITEEADAASLAPTYHVYSRRNLIVTDDVVWYQIPDRILSDFGLDVRTGSTAASRYRSRYTPDRIHRLADLHGEAKTLRSRLGT